MCIRDRVRVMTGSNDNSSLGLYKAVEKTDENGNNYFAYEEMFTGPVSYTHLDVYKRQIYDTAGYGIYRNMRWRKLLAECLGKCIYTALAG